MNKILLAIVLAASLLTGCASVPMESSNKSDQLKRFESPSNGSSGIYVFRKDSVVGAALKKDVWIDKKCIGETAKGIFFYHEVNANQDHTVSTESEFSPNDLVIKAKPGELYFVEQYIKMGAFVGGAGLTQTDKENGKSEVSKLQLAKMGNCSVER